MIERIYVDNFRCLVNCEVRLASTALLLGGNGSGKSAVFDAVAALQQFIDGKSNLLHLFPRSNLTRWQSRNEQRFELDVRLPDGFYQYVLVLKYPADSPCTIVSETLKIDGQPLREYVDGDIGIYNDQGSKDGGGHLPYLAQSVVSFREDPGQHRKWMEFHRYVSKMLLVRPCPISLLMNPESPEESAKLNLHADNFSSWYRFISRQDISRQADLLRELKTTIDGFDSMGLEGPAEGTATLRVRMKNGGDAKPFDLKLNELSDGQRQLILLYTLLYGIDNTTRTLFLDEPDNYLSLREIQPWLNELTDAVGRGVGQAVIISHHPEIIDSLARDRGIWFTRDEGGPTRIERREFTNNEPLSPSELQARGW